MPSLKLARFQLNIFILEIQTDLLISKNRFEYGYIRYIMDIFKFGLEMEEFAIMHRNTDSHQRTE